MRLVLGWMKLLFGAMVGAILIGRSFGHIMSGKSHKEIFPSQYNVEKGISIRAGSNVKAFVLTMGTSTRTSTTVVVQAFEQSLMELVSRTTRKTRVSVGKVTFLAEYSKDQTNFKVLCVPSNGELIVKGLGMVEIPRQLFEWELQTNISGDSRHVNSESRNLRHRRRDKPYYASTISNLGQGSSVLTVDSLIERINEKAAGSFSVASMAGTDSTKCGGNFPGGLGSKSEQPLTRVPTLAPLSNSPSLGSGLIKSSKPTSSLSRTPSGSPTTTTSKRSVESLAPSMLLTAQPSSENSKKPSHVESSFSPSVIPTAQPSSDNSQKSSSSPSLVPSVVPTTEISSHPSLSLQPSVPLPTTSFQPSVSYAPTESFRPSVSNAPSLPPPDWEQFGNTIRGSTISKVVFSNDGTLVGTILASCASTTSGDPAEEEACGRVFRNEDLGLWINVGDPVFAPTNMSFVDISLSGDGSSVAFLSDSKGPDDDGNQSRHAQVLSLSGTSNEPMGNAIVEELGFNASATSNVCVEGALLVVSMGNGTAQYIQAHVWTGTEWSKWGEPLTAAYGKAAIEFSRACRTIVIMDVPKRSHIWTLEGREWTPNDAGFPDTNFASIAVDGSGSTLATRTFSSDGYINIYRLVGKSWQRRASIASGQVYESTFGYKLDISAEGTTVAIATFRPTATTLISCTQAFQYNGTDWAPLGRPPCLTFEQGHSGFGTYLALSGNGRTMAVGDLGSFTDPKDNGHIHTYQFIERTGV